MTDHAAKVWTLVPGTELQVKVQNRINDLAAAGAQRWAVTRQGDLITWTGSGPATQMSLGQIHGRSLGFEPKGQTGWVGGVVEGANLIRLLKITDGGKQRTEVKDIPASSPGGLCGLEVLSETCAIGCGTFDPKNPPGIWRTTNGDSWDDLPLPPGTRNLTDLIFWTKDEGLIVGGQQDPLRPLIAWTEDGGKKWHAGQISGFSGGGYCWKVYFLDRATGFASVAHSGDKGMILATVDGGRNWSAHELKGQVVGGVNAWDLQGIGFADPKLGWVCQRTGVCFETTDGGNSWKAGDAKLTDLNRFVFVDKELLACGDAIFSRPL